MVEIKDYDADAYELEFEENTSDEERKYYVKTYPNVNMVADKRLHCTTCNTHIGCAVANELTIRMHPVLRVTHCKKCHTFYNSGEFCKGEDGSELYCRWCGQGGEVYCCSKCAYVFCKKCIVQNLSRSVITDIENNDNWQCFSCSPSVMWPLRAQHWALVNYIEKTKKKILSEEKDDEKIYELMNKDPALCCKDRKAQKFKKNPKSKRKRRYSSTTDSDCSIPEPKRIADHSAVLPKMVTLPAKDKSSKTDELVCTPDILSMLNEPADDMPRASSYNTSSPNVPASQKAATSQPPPLIIRQLPTTSQVQTVRFPNRQFSAVPRAAAPPPPAYYTVNGFRVDLNAAAQQETYRLPNGKLIQVKKQTASSPLTGGNNANRNATHLQPRSNNANPNPYSIRFNIQPSIQPAQVQIQHQVTPPVVHQTPAAQTLHQQHLQQQQQILNGMSNVPMVAALPTPPPVLTRYPNTPLGHSQTELEKEIHGAQDICQQIIAKCNTLMKSNAYKSVRSFNDVKDLQLHLSYLFTYTIDKFTTLQSKCTDIMKSLSLAHEAANKLADKKNKYTNVDDDLEVVEPSTVCIEIDSDDDAEPQKKTETVAPAGATKAKQPRKTNHQPKSTDTIKITEVRQVSQIEIADDGDELELPLPPVLEPEDVPPAPEPEDVPPALEPDDELSYDRESDEKLKSLPKVILEKSAEIERKLKEILEQDKSENGDVLSANDESVVEINDSDECTIVEKNDSDECTIVEKSDSTIFEKNDSTIVEKNDSDECTIVEKNDSMILNDSTIEEKNDSDECMILKENETNKCTTENTSESTTEAHICITSSRSEDNGCNEAKVNAIDQNSENAEAVENHNKVQETLEKTLENNKGAENYLNNEKDQNESEEANKKKDENDIEYEKKQNESEETKEKKDENDIEEAYEKEDDKDKEETHIMEDAHNREDENDEKDENKMDENVVENDAKGGSDDQADKLPNGKNDDNNITVECSANSADFSCPQSPALTDNLEHDLLDEIDHQNNLTDNSFEDISSPDMFDDMSKNGFDKATENIVTLSTENADPDLV